MLVVKIRPPNNDYDWNVIKPEEIENYIYEAGDKYEIEVIEMEEEEYYKLPESMGW